MALAHGLNVNLVRKWLVGRGLKRSGLVAPRTVKRTVAAITQTPPMQFVPVEFDAAVRAAMVDEQAPETPRDIHIELRRASAQSTVCWPSSQAAQCASWLRELAAEVLK